MKKLFLILMLFLLPLQYTWAMVASYDIHGAQETQAHFGHHEHQATEGHAEKNKSDKNTQTAKIHDHFGFSHMSSCEVLSHDFPIFVSEAKQFSIQYLFTYHSPPNYQPERPNWISPV